MEIPGTDVSATTIHAFFDLDAEKYTTRLDFAKRTVKVQTILALDVLLLDEVAGSRIPGPPLIELASDVQPSRTGSGFLDRR